MATVHGSIQYRLFDYLGVTTSKVFYFECSDAKTLAQIMADAAVLEPLLDAVTDGASDGHASFSINFAPTGLKTAPNEGNPLNTGALSTFAEVGQPQRSFSDLVPAVAQAIIVNGHIDETTGQPYDLYVSDFTVALTNIQLESNDGRLLSKLVRNDINTRKHRRKQQIITSEEA